MNYLNFPEADVIRVEYEGPNLDLHALGVLQTALADLVDKTAEAALVQAGFVEGRRVEPDDPYPYEWRGRVRVGPSALGRNKPLRAEVRSARTGSWHQEIVLFLAPLFADPNVRGVLQGVGGNIVYYILTRARNVLRRAAISGQPTQPAPAIEPSPYDQLFARDVERIVRTLGRNAQGRPVSLKIVSQASDGRRSEADIQF